MQDNKNERILKDIADKYVQIEGKKLLADNELLKDAPASPALDRKVRGIGRRYSRAAGITGLLAAGIALFLLLSPKNLHVLPQASGEAGNSYPSATIASLGGTLIPLSFELPERFSLTYSSVDNGMSAHKLADALSDDVTLTIDPKSPATTPEGAAMIDFGAGIGYAFAGADYQMLIIESDGYVYSLTCRYDINTLLPLGRKILS